MRQMFDEVAPRYDLVNRFMTFGLDRGWRRRTLQALALAPHSRVLDLACGTGDFARELRRRAYVALGLDVSFGMLRAARAGGAPLLLGDSATLPILDASLDGVVSGFALRNFTDLEGTITECARVLRPLGRIALLEVDEPGNPLVRAGNHLWFRRAVPLIGAALSSAEAYRYLPRSVAYLPSAPELTRMLTSAGFSDVERLGLLGGSAQIVTATRVGRFGIAI